MEAVVNKDKPVVQKNQTTRQMRVFASGATRDASDDKLDYDGFMSWEVIERYAQYMHKHRKQADGQLRSSDNWKKGIPRDQYRKSMTRHTIDWAKAHRARADQAKHEEAEELACAMLFNIFGDLFESLVERGVIKRLEKTNEGEDQ